MALTNINLVIGQTFTVKAGVLASNGITLNNDCGLYGVPLTSDTVTYSVSGSSVTIQQGDTHFNNYLLEAGKGSTGTFIRTNEGLSCLITAVAAGTSTITVTSVQTPATTTTFTVIVANNTSSSIVVNAE